MADRARPPPITAIPVATLRLERPPTAQKAPPQPEHSVLLAGATCVLVGVEDARFRQKSGTVLGWDRASGRVRVAVDSTQILVRHEKLRACP